MAVPDNILVHSMEVLLEANSEDRTQSESGIQPDNKIKDPQTSGPQEGRTMVLLNALPSVSNCEESEDSQITTIELTAEQAAALIATQQTMHTMSGADIETIYSNQGDGSPHLNKNDIGQKSVDRSLTENENFSNGKFKTVECQTKSWEEIVAMLTSNKSAGMTSQIEDGCDSGSSGGALDICRVYQGPGKSVSDEKQVTRYYCKHCSEQYSLCQHMCSFLRKSKDVLELKSKKAKKKKPKKQLDVHVDDQVHVSGGESTRMGIDEENPESRPFKCQICGKSFTKLSRLKCHQVVHTGVKAFKCKHCDKSYSQKSSLNAHSRLHSSEAWFRCDDCFKYFRTIERLEKHRSVHEEKKQFGCPQCEGVFKTIDSLDRHLVKHGEQQSRLCEHCGKSFANKKSLGQHLKFMHADAETSGKGNTPGLNCDLCEKKFRSKYHLISHRITHTNSRPFACDECEKTYRTQSALRVHKKAVHCGIKDHVCETCQARFATPAQLRNHQTVHTGERPYKCPMCEMAYRHPNSLRLHIRGHTGEKPHVCPHCGQRFRFPGNLKSHIMTHTKERPYQCDQCGKKFARQATLVDHKKSHSGEKNCICPFCGKAYRLRGHLRYHMKSHTKRQERDNSGAGINPSVPVKIELSDHQFPTALQGLTRHPFHIYESYQ